MSSNDAKEDYSKYKQTDGTHTQTKINKVHLQHGSQFSLAPKPTDGTPQAQCEVLSSSELHRQLDMVQGAPATLQ